MAKQPQRCGTCRFLDVGKKADGARDIKRNFAYRCLWQPRKVPLPDSITKEYGYRPDAPRMHMAHSDGATCPTWQPLD